MIDDRLTEDIEVGAKAVPLYSTEIVTTDGGFEVRRSRWRYPRHRFEFNLSPNPRDEADLIEFRDLYYAAGGAYETFKFKHWSDYQATDAALEMITGTTWQLRKSYTRGATTRYRKITRPVAGTLSIKRNGVSYASSNWTLDATTGIVTFNTSQAGQSITGTFEFDIPVRFEDDEIELVGLSDDLEQPISISLIEVRE